MQLTQANEVEQMRNLITKVFGRSPPPEEIVEAESLEYDDERKMLFTDFHGKNWWNIEYAVLYKHCRSIPLLNDSGFSYFMPAYVTACLALDREEAYDMCAVVMMNLNPYLENGELNQSVFRRLNQFSSEQKKALAEFVTSFASINGLVGSEARSGSRYWNSESH